MGNIWLQRKLTLIQVINEITETDYDDINLSIVLNLLWTLEDEERDYLIETLKEMITAEFDDLLYSKAFLEQLDLICTIPLPEQLQQHMQPINSSLANQDRTEREADLLFDEAEDNELEDDFSDEEIEDDDDQPVVPRKFTIKHSWIVFIISTVALFVSLSRYKKDFSLSTVVDAVPHWAYFWYELFFVVGVLVIVGYLIRSLANSLAEHLATFGYLICFFPLLWLLKGFNFSSHAELYFHGLIMVIAIASGSRICGHATVK